MKENKEDTTCLSLIHIYALDFDDLIMKTVELLQSDPEVKNYYQERFHYIMAVSYSHLDVYKRQILSHEHFQAGHYEFAMAKAPVEKEISFKGFEDVKAGIVKWPMSVIRISGRPAVFVGVTSKRRRREGKKEVRDYD